MSGIGQTPDSPGYEAPPAIGGGDPYKPPPAPAATGGYYWMSGTLIPPPTPAPGGDPARPDPPRLLTDEDLARLWPNRSRVPSVDSFFLEQVADDPYHWLNGTTGENTLLRVLRVARVVPEAVLEHLVIYVDRVLDGILKLARENADVALVLDQYLARVIDMQARAREIHRKAKIDTGKEVKP